VRLSPIGAILLRNDLIARRGLEIGILISRSAPEG
jgi:hypothetical protein